MFRPVNRSSPDLQQNKSKVLLESLDPNILYFCLQLYKILESQFSNSTFDLFCWRPDDDLLTGRNM